MEINQRKSTLSNKIYIFSKTRGTVSGKFMMTATLLGQRAYCNVEHLKQTSRKDRALYNPETGTLQIMAAGLFEACKTGVPDENGRLPVAQTYNHLGTGAVSRKRLLQSSSIMTQNMLRKDPQLTVIEFCNWYLVPRKGQRCPYRLHSNPPAPKHLSAMPPLLSSPLLSSPLLSSPLLSAPLLSSLSAHTLSSKHSRSSKTLQPQTCYNASSFRTPISRTGKRQSK